MDRTVPAFRQWLNAKRHEWMKMKIMLPQEERKALKELLDAAVTRSDVGSIVPRLLPSETMFMLMLIRLETRVKERKKESRAKKLKSKRGSTFDNELRHSRRVE
jgi:predicted phage tail protein